MNLYQPQIGLISYFQRSKSPKTLKSGVLGCLCPAKAELFRGTIRSNLSLGLDHEPSEQEPGMRLICGSGDANFAG